AATHRLCGQGAGLEEAGVPQPFVDALALAGGEVIQSARLQTTWTTCRTLAPYFDSGFRKLLLRSGGQSMPPSTSWSEGASRPCMVPLSAVSWVTGVPGPRVVWLR